MGFEHVQVQAESAVHADGLVSISKKLEGLGRDIEDTRDLLAELQGESAARSYTPASISEKGLSNCEIFGVQGSHHVLLRIRGWISIKYSNSFPRGTLSRSQILSEGQI